MTAISRLADVHDAAGAFLDAAFSALAERRVVPPSIYHPFLEVGRDYEGSSVGTLKEFGVLDRFTQSRFPRAVCGFTSHRF